MKSFRRIFAFLLCLATIFSLSIPAYAATSYKKVVSGETFALTTQYRYKSDGSRIRNNTYYKVVLPTDSVLKIKWTKNNDNDLHIGFYANTARSKTIDYISTNGKVSGSESFALAKGTYYFDMYDGSTVRYDGNPTVKITITVTDEKDINKDNYCKARAIKINANKWASIAQTPNHSYERWYKIILTKNQRITIETNTMYSWKFRLYSSSSSRSIKFDEDYESVKKTVDVLAAGIYYVKVESPDSFGEYEKLGDYLRFRWH